MVERLVAETTVMANGHVIPGNSWKVENQPRRSETSKELLYTETVEKE